MIFVTVGTQMPFDRLVGAVDAWAARHPDVRVFAQIGAGGTPPAHVEHRAELEPSEFAARLRAADCVVAHAGCGTILGALELGKPVVVVPRRADLGEHRNDHQLATARRFAALASVHVALTEDDLVRVLDTLDELAPVAPIESEAPLPLVAAIREFINSDARSGR